MCFFFLLIADLFFVYYDQVADHATLYGVCLHVQEIVQHPPSILGVIPPLSQPSGMRSRFLVSAPRCYCILTRVPFFELHYEMLNRFESPPSNVKVLFFVGQFQAFCNFLFSLYLTFMDAV